MRRSILPILLVLSLVLAGCNAIPLGGDETPEQTFTPAPVPTDRPTPTPIPKLAPGLLGTGVTDPFALVGAHAAVLNGTSYTYHKNFTIWYANGTIFNQVTTRAQYAANHSRFYIIQRGFDINVRGGESFSMWSDGERVLIARTSNNSTSYIFPRSANGEPVPPQELSFYGGNNYAVAALFSSVETRVVDSITRNGTTLYRVVATNVTNPAAFMGQQSRNVTLRALISSRGLVRESHLTFTATLNNNTVRIHRHFRYTDIGNTTIERPLWYDEAIENVSTAPPTTTR